MSPKKFILLGLLVGSTIGNYIPALWGDSSLSITSVLFSFIGGAAGIFIAYKMVS